MLAGFVATNAVVITAGYLVLGLGLQATTCHNRVTGALPLGMVFPAIAIVQCTSVLWRGGLWPLQWLRAASVAALVVLCAVASLRTYFSYYTGSLQFGSDHSEAAWIARDYADPTRSLVSWSFRYGPWDSQELISPACGRSERQDSDAAYIRGVQPMARICYRQRSGVGLARCATPASPRRVSKPPPDPGRAVDPFVRGRPRTTSP